MLGQSLPLLRGGHAGRLLCVNIPVFPSTPQRWLVTMPPNKRRKLDPDHEETVVERNSSTLNAPISPPKRQLAARSTINGDGLHHQKMNSATVKDNAKQSESTHIRQSSKGVSSPVQLIRIPGLKEPENLDTLSIRDILGDPLIKECWAFNFCFDVDWLMTNFDEDVRDQVKVTLVHGSWRRESPTKVAIDDAVKRLKNVRAVTAYMPDPFGTHHTKMFVLLKHDDAAQVIIHTANLLPQDWRMCQAVWRSPLLPLRSTPSESASNTAPRFGTGSRFGYDLLSYVDAYGGKLKALRDALRFYDFTDVKACLVASTPSRQTPTSLDIATKTLWGWPALEQTVKRIPAMQGSSGHFVAQVSSIATLGVTPAWLHGTLLRAMKGSPTSGSNAAPGIADSPKPKLSVVFPTADEIRRSIDGYACGGSIHTKLQTAANQKQLRYLMPHLCHWAGDRQEHQSVGAIKVRKAGRQRTGPHIKTYLRFVDAEMTKLDWAMVTSANLSKQAWGTEGTAQGEVRISSFEAGIIFWPDLWKEDGKATRMVPVFKTDTPEQGENDEIEVGWRMPYDLPLVPYAEDEEPWCATKPHLEPDWKGRVWQG